MIALLIGSRRVHPWAMAALAAFVLFQLYELATAPSLGVAALTVLDMARNRRLGLPTPPAADRQSDPS